MSGPYVKLGMFSPTVDIGNTSGSTNIYGTTNIGTSGSSNITIGNGYGGDIKLNIGNPTSTIYMGKRVYISNGASGPDGNEGIIYFGYGFNEYIKVFLTDDSNHQFNFGLIRRDNVRFKDGNGNDGYFYTRYGMAGNQSLGDFAEMFEWEDQNPEKEKRVGYSVVVNEQGLIRKATIEDNPNDIIGAVSATATITGSAAAFDYNKKYLKDDFEQNILDASGNAMINPDYDESLTYKNRSERPEWDPIGICGKLIVRNESPINPKWRLIGTRQTARIYLV
jgi:hypothetical protein